MDITRDTLCEMIVRDFATKYLDLQAPFELEEVVKATDKNPVRMLCCNEFYTLADIKYCMRVLGLHNSFSAVRAEEFTEIMTKNLINYHQTNDNILNIFLYDIINSLPTSGPKIIKCRKCGCLFVPDHGNRKNCRNCSK